MSDHLEKIRAVARDCAPSHGRTTDPRFGQQHIRYWLPEPLKELLIEEFRKSEDEKTEIAVVKYFNPSGAGTWYFSEYDDEEGLFYGLCEIHEAEHGYVDLKELRDLRCPPFGLPIERDYWFTPQPLRMLRASS